MSLTYLTYFALLLTIPLLASMKVKRTYKRFEKVPAMRGLSGAEVARLILHQNGIYDVEVRETRGFLSDHYHPGHKTVNLSSSIYHGHSIAGTAVAAHEVGHAIQDAQDYSFLRFRHALVPVANLGSNFSYILIFIGAISGMLGLVWLGIAFMAFAVLFQFVTLPVEFNASSRAMDQLVSLGILQNNEEPSAKKVLNAAALTYVAATVVAVMELLRLLAIFGGSDE
ncbi:zinc metallopeptidase [Bacillaceae bacterium SIJ1]|uniref:zinc metallopeptidase n=1 Tax=Litoribacterium kuwaitense TaxID=1398745 RepID=UPI0013EB7FF9|nr:zinc metallopeptidase [Litoribacterium kuwaitense]NGP43727.1 zinc metallopeptidase [Litoribacterium kuwaitense]